MDVRQFSEVAGKARGVNIPARYIVGCLLLLISITSTDSHAGMLATPTGSQAEAHGATSVRVLRTMTMSASVSLRFGAMTPGLFGGTATVSVTNGHSITGHVQLLGLGSFSRGEFLVSGEPNYSYTVELPDQIAVSGPGASHHEDLVGYDFQIYSVNRGSIGHHGRLDHTGHDTLYLGASLQFPAGIKTGHYRMSIPISVHYQ